MTIFFLIDIRIFIHYRYLPEAGDLPPEDHHAFLVEDMETYRQQLTSQGLDLEILPQDYYWDRSAYLREPCGRQIEITQKGN